MGQGGAVEELANQEADTLDAFMADIAKVQDKQKRAKESDQMDLPNMFNEGMSVMDVSRTKTITLEEVTALTGGGAPTPSASSSSKPPKQAEAGGLGVVDQGASNDKMDEDEEGVAP